MQRNTNRTAAQALEGTHKAIENYKAEGLTLTTGGISAAFGCNFEGDISDEKMLAIAAQLFEIAAEHDLSLTRFVLLDTMAWATPMRVKRILGALRDKYPDIEFSLHLHNTRGMGIANAQAGLEMGVAHFDACVGGLGGCPFAGHAGAAGNVCTEDLVFMCNEMGIETGLDLEALSECARLAEDIVGHPLPGSVMKGGSLQSYRDKLAGTA
jgi:hydroxymethylglutaryl-CoA lyase